ncbi:MAG: low temperature requirement protein A [Cyanobacteriota bacterium]|nr:low temperature requirement protein A [Cyanobacteriota bacterium]
MLTNWFQPPQLRIDEESRRATWLELFFDLIFVVAVSQLAHKLYDQVSFTGFCEFVILFFPVWWAWIGATFYANRFDVDDIGHRLLTGLQMLAIAGMAVNIHHGLDTSSTGFALAYATVRFLLVFQYSRAARHIPQARSLATYYGIGFAVAASLWLLSVFVPIPYRFILWLLGLVIDFGIPLTATEYQKGLLPQTEHLPERFGLFTIIVLGEAIIAVVDGIAQKDWQVSSVLAAVAGFLIAFSLWWIYFENVGGSALRMAARHGQLWVYQIWLYGHLPLVIGLAATGVGVEQAVLSDPALPLPEPQRWLLCGSVVLVLISLAILHRIGIIFPCKARSRYRLLAAGLLLALAVWGSPLTPLSVMALVAAVGVSQIAQDIYQGHPPGYAVALPPIPGEAEPLSLSEGHDS